MTPTAVRSARFHKECDGKAAALAKARHGEAEDRKAPPRLCVAHLAPTAIRTGKKKRGKSKKYAVRLRRVWEDWLMKE
ncbi:hypothetical protein SKAU_G00330070 [Synaphobranchus kaupii]|uniref:Uncharacterized protein n=1 Tax=Synaphobranchus kaupii TaxID=118154 RepID=A0A9Q1IKS1_SYNKA|nr:hypothetical protein SKAU_G00330070 [Synaphobranchus kaupii]